MKKQKRQLLIVLILLVVIAAAYAGMKLLVREEEAEVTQQEYPVTNTDKDTITSFSVTKDGTTLSFVLEEGSWYYEQDRSVRIDSDAVWDMASKAAILTGTDKIDEVADLSQYGLQDSGYRVSFGTDSYTVTVLFGDYNSMTSQYYLCVEGERTVYTTDSYTYELFEKTLEDLTLTEPESETESETETGTEAETAPQADTETDTATEAETGQNAVPEE